MRGTVSAHQARTVQRKHHGQVLQGHVVNQLVVAALQERGVDGHDRLHAFAGHACGERDGMLLGDAHVVVAVGKALFKLDHARALAHGRGDAHQARVLRRHVAQPLAEHLGERLLGGRGWLGQAHAGVELAGAVVGHGVGLGQLVALALLGHHVQELRALQALDVFQRRDQRVEVVPVDGADVVKAEFLEQRGGHHHAFGLLLEALGQFEQGRHRAQHGLAHVLGGGIELPAHQLRKVAVESAHGGADAHVVVVQHHQQVAVGHARVVERLEGHAGTHRAVANNGYRMAVVALALGGQCHAQGCRDAGAGMRRAKGVVDALGALRKARDAAQLAQRVHAVAAAGQDLVRVGLVAHVPHQAVFRGVEDMVQGHGQLHRAQVGAEVATGLRHALQHELAQLGRQHLEVCAREPTQVCRVIDGLQQGKGCRGH